MSSDSTTDPSPTRSASGATSPTSVGSPDAASPSNLDIKFVDSRWFEDDDTWNLKYVDTEGESIAAEKVQPVGVTTASDDSWDGYCFVVVRQYSKPRDKDDKNLQISFKVIIKSAHLLKACMEVMGTLRGVSWNSPPVTLEPRTLVTFFPKLEEYEKELSSMRIRNDEEESTLASVRVFLDYIRQNYGETLKRVANLVSNSEITFDLMYAIHIPGTICIHQCTVTREPRALRLLSSQITSDNCGQLYHLTLEGLEASSNEDDDDEEPENKGWTTNHVKGNEGNERRKTANGTARLGMTEVHLIVREFEGVEKIYEQSVYPVSHHPQSESICAVLIERGRKWMEFCGTTHAHYAGIGVEPGDQKSKRYSVKSRIVVDIYNYTKYSSSEPPFLRRLLGSQNKKRRVNNVDDRDLLLATPILYGYSLSDKLWLQFNVNHVSRIKWNDEAFAGLVLPEERKTLLRSLVEANAKLNSRGAAFDDFVRGKGQGLVINLFGPPGVGKTLSAEATSEHLRRPLYVVGGGDLGTSAGNMDHALSRTFELAASWNAVLLIDEADVFLEQRSLSDMERNAMVAVFLRHIEYYRGILFLTTNRITTFDEAFLSRIHVALHFGELQHSTRERIWRAFLKKAGFTDAAQVEHTAARLAARNVNGRQIKNACRTASSLALSRGERVAESHLDEALDAMEEFFAEFARLQNRGEREERLVESAPPQVEVEVEVEKVPKGWLQQLLELYILWFWEIVAAVSARIAEVEARTRVKSE